MSFNPRSFTPRRPLLVAALAAAMFATPVAVGLDVAWANSRGEVRRLIQEEAYRTMVPASLALAVAKVESDFREKYEGPDGARGAMGVLPQMAHSSFGYEPEEMWHVRSNARVALEMLENLLDAHQGRWVPALAQYGARRHSADPAALLRERVVDEYVRTVLSWQDQFASEAERVELAAARGEALAALGVVPAPARFAAAAPPAAVVLPTLRAAPPRLPVADAVERRRQEVLDALAAHPQDDIAWYEGSLAMDRGDDGLSDLPNRPGRWIAPGGSRARVWPAPERSRIARHGDAPAGAALIGDAYAGDLQRRLAHARRTLDDFGPIERYPARRGW